MNIYKTMYHAPKPEGIERRKAYIVGGGIAGLAAAVFLVDDAQMPGENITILEKTKLVGGSLDAAEGSHGYRVPRRKRAGAVHGMPLVSLQQDPFPGRAGQNCARRNSGCQQRPCDPFGIPSAAKPGTYL